MPTGGTWWRRLVVGLTVGIAGAVPAVGIAGALPVGSAAAGAANARPTSTSTIPNAPTTTTSTSPLTLSDWKAQYGPAVGEIADDALVVFATGKKNAKHPTKKKATTMVGLCRKWHKDALTVPQQVPPIPVARVERVWQTLVTASLSASSDCVTALQSGSSSATKDFRKQLARVHDAEKTLVAEFGRAGQ